VRTDCRICHGTSLELILSLAPTPIGDEYLLEAREQPLHPIDLYQCQDCGLAQLLYEISPEEIYRDYLYLTGSSVGLDEHFARYAKHVVALANLGRGDLVVDIGSNDGTLLKHFKALGMRVMGIEASSSIAALARSNGIRTLEGYFKKDMGLGKANLVTANNVVANIADLDEFMEALLDLLAPRGTFVFESFYLGDVVRNKVFDFIYHEHLSAFSVKPVKALMKRHGLSLYHVEHFKTKGGSIRYYCNRYYAGRGIEVGVDEVEDDDDELYEAQTYIDFTKRIVAEREKTRSFCREAKARGAKIAGFGASISCTTLLYHFGLGEFIDYLVDDNPAKQGRLSPGLHLPVYPPSELYKRHPDVVLVLAWRFVEDFRREHPGFGLIVPLPQCRLIRT
jgi:SAM-dependent methyltransferase